ncbi:hypothetical protein ACOMHN_032052 [Nucella lapillus]
MEHSSGRPLNPQVFKSRAEIKDFRLNRTEQWRLKSAQSHISHEERNFHRDFKSCRTQVENHYLRRLSRAVVSQPGAQDTVCRVQKGLGGPRVLGQAAVRLVSAGLRGQVPAPPPAAAELRRGGGGGGEGGAGRYLLTPTPITAKSSVVTDTEHDFHPPHCSGLESRPCGSANGHPDMPPPLHHAGREADPQTRTHTAQHDVRVENGRAEKASHSSQCQDASRSKAVEVHAEDTDPQGTDCNALTAQQLRSRVMTANMTRPRHYSKPGHMWWKNGHLWWENGHMWWKNGHLWWENGHLWWENIQLWWKNGLL